MSAADEKQIFPGASGSPSALWLASSESGNYFRRRSYGSLLSMEFQRLSEPHVSFDLVQPSAD